MTAVSRLSLLRWSSFRFVNHFKEYGELPFAVAADGHRLEAVTVASKKLIVAFVRVVAVVAYVAYCVHTTVQACFRAWQDSDILDPECLEGFSQFRDIKITESRVNLEGVDGVSDRLCRDAIIEYYRSGKEVPQYVEKNLVWKSQE
jgi:hypothetical protein